MPIDKVIIKNYRSIKELNLKLGDINALIGANNSGKSNIMRALNIVLGERWPQPFDPEDYHNFNTSEPIVIETRFTTPIQNAPSYAPSDVWGFQLSCDGGKPEFVALDIDGEVMTYGLQNRPVNVTNVMRDDVALLYLGLDRQSNQVVKSSKWTLYGKLLQHIEKNIEPSKRDAFSSTVEQAYRTNLLPDLQPMEDLLKEHIRGQTGLNVTLRLSILKPLEVISTLRPYLQDAAIGFDYDCEEAGAGVQSALAIAIARAYAEIVHEPFTIAIEEPELYLHPHGCRHFYRLMKDLASSGVQVIYTTHERSFVQLSEFKGIHRVRKASGQTKVHNCVSSSMTTEDCIFYASKFDDSLNEVFFSDLVILVEGSPDRIACKIALEKLGLELDKLNISLVDGGGGISKIRPLCDVLKLFGIPSVALVDADLGNVSTALEIARLLATIGNDRVFLQLPKLEGMLRWSHKPDKYEAMEMFPEWFDTHTMPQVYVDLYDKVRALI